MSGAFQSGAFQTGAGAAGVTRTQFRNALFSILSDQQAATPAELKKVLRYRPGGMGGEKPVAWIGSITHALAYDAGTRRHLMAAEVVVATTFPSDLITSADTFDDLLTNLIERFTANPVVIADTITTLDGIVDGEISFTSADGSATIYRGATLACNLQVWEGRQ